MSFLLSLLISISAFGANPCQGKKRVFYFNMPIFIGNKVFNDQVEICQGAKGLIGQLTVPKRFTSPLENIKIEGDKLSFSITADEGRGKFQVFYSGQLLENKKFFSGFAHLKDKKPLGPFVGINSSQRTKLELIQ